jgi:hypothetical protein
VWPGWRNRSRCEVGGGEQIVDLADDEAIEASDGFPVAVSFGDLWVQVGLGARLAAFPGDGDDIQGPVALPIPTAVQPVPLSFTGGGAQRVSPHSIANAASLCTRSGFATYRHQHLAGGLGACATNSDQLWRQLGH